ncbi:MAG TPA: VCBS repeat-containing protein [Myxococcota bacterium]|nr:VCBS repeat-containing protein [Myxococcota bacterium]
MAACALLPLARASAAGQEGPETLFSLHAHELPGRIVEAWPLSVSSCAGSDSDLLVLHVEGGPPSPRRRVTWMPCGSAVRPGDPAIRQKTLAPEVAGIDVALLPGRRGPQLLSVSARGLEIAPLPPSARDGDGAADPSRRGETDGSYGDEARERSGEREQRIFWPAPERLPLPPRPRLVSRIRMVDDWHSSGRPSVLLPSLSGALLLDPGTGRTRGLPLPLYADYETSEPFLPSPVWSWMTQEVHWPTLARADDDGDGRLDLFALSRWSVWIYRAGSEGLPMEPTRRLELAPFDEETERRFRGTSQTHLARDLDGDGRAELLLTSITGSLTRSRSVTRIHAGGAQGVDLRSAPLAVRESEGGFSELHPVDLDGDGRVELVETTMELGLLQLVRILLTRRAETTVRVLVLDAGRPEGLRVAFEDDLSFRLDFGEASVSGLLPALGDWNGDGIQDLHVSRGEEAIGFRLGSDRPDEPLFGAVVGDQPLPLGSGRSRSADLDGDGLDDIIAFDRTDPDAPLVVLQNRGRLPGTPPTLRPAPRRSARDR